MIGRALLAAGLLSAGVACGGTAETRSIVTSSQAPALVVTDDDTTLPASCRPRAIGGLLLNLLSAVNRGDRKAARVYLPEGARYPRDGERLRLLEVIVGYANGKGQVEFRVERRADDSTTTRTSGKGAIDCDRGRIVAWGMGTDTRAGRICPSPQHHSEAAVACVRHWR